MGSKPGMLSQVLYLLIGLIGVPVFANGGGPGYIFQPSFGYLLSCPLAAYIAGFARLSNYRNEKIFMSKNFYRIVFLNFLSVLTISFFGVIYLYLNVNLFLGKNFSFNNALWAGFAIFLPGDIVKVILASYIFIKLQKSLSRGIYG